MKNNFLHKLKYRVQFNIPTYLVKLLCFISFYNSKLLVYEYSKTVDWIGGCIGTVEHQKPQCSPPIKTITAVQSIIAELVASAAPDEQRCTSQATRIASEPTWASTDLLEVIEEVPYHELFIHNFEELVPRSWAVREFFISGCHM